MNKEETSIEYPPKKENSGSIGRLIKNLSELHPKTYWARNGARGSETEVIGSLQKSSKKNKLLLNNLLLIITCSCIFDQVVIAFSVR